MSLGIVAPTDPPIVRRVTFRCMNSALDEGGRGPKRVPRKCSMSEELEEGKGGGDLPEVWCRQYRLALRLVGPLVFWALGAEDCQEFGRGYDWNR